MSITIRYNRSSVHIEGLETLVTGGGNDMGSHISNYSYSTCPALTRYATTMGYLSETVELRNAEDPTIPVGRVKRSKVVREFETAAEALEAAREYVSIHGGKVCLKCEARALKG
jgi:hypothetical protein